MNKNFASELEAKVQAAYMEQDRVVMEAKMDGQKSAQGLVAENSKLHQVLEHGLERYHRVADGILDQVMKEVRDTVVGLPEPVHQELSHMINGLQATFSAEDEMQKSRLANLLEQLEKLQELLLRNPGDGDRLVGIDLPLYLKHNHENLVEKEKNLQHLYVMTSREEQNVKRTLDQRMLYVESSLRMEINEERRLMKLRMKNLTQAQMKQVKDSSKDRAEFIVAHNDMMNAEKDSQAYLRKIVGRLSETFQESNEALHLMYTRSKEKLAGITGAKQGEMYAAAERAHEKVAGRISAAMDAKRGEDREIIEKYWPVLEAFVVRGMEYNLKRVRELMGFLAQHYDKYDERAQNKTNTIRMSLEATAQYAQMVYDHEGVMTEDVAKRCEAIIQLSDRMQRQFNAFFGKIKQEQEFMKELLQDERDSLMRAATGYIDKKRKKIVDDLSVQFQKLRAGVGNVGQVSHAAFQKLQQEVGVMGQEESAVKRIGAQAGKMAEDHYRKIERKTKSELMRGKENMQTKAQDTGDDMEVVTASYAGVVDQAAGVVSGLNGKTDSMTEDQENAADKLANRTEVAQKTMRSAAEAAMMGFKETAQSAGSKIVGWRSGMQAKDHEAYQMAKGLDSRRTRYEYEAGKQLQTFHSQVAMLQDELHTDSKFLDTYERYTLSASLRLVRKAGDLLEKTAAASDVMYNGILDREFKFMDEAAKLESGDSFSTMKKIRMATVVIDGALREDEGFVKQLSKHEHKSLNYMEKVLNILEQEHKAVAQHEHTVEAQDEQVVDHEGYHLSQFVDQAVHDIGENSAAFEQLGNTSDEAAKAILAGSHDI